MAAIQINHTLSTADGGTVLSGSYLTFKVTFNNSYNVTAEPSLYRTYSCFTGNTRPVITTELPRILRYTLTEEEYNNANPTSMMTLFQNSIELKIGSGTTQIVS